jgi:hypothetical protein
MIILYLIVAFFIFFIVYKKKREYIYDDRYKEVKPAVLFVISGCLLWIFILPLILLWKIFEIIYNKIS